MKKIMKKNIKTLLRENLIEYVEPSNIIRAYHGSNTNITNFVDDFVGGTGADDADGPGIYFTSQIDNARMFGNVIYVVDLNTRKMITNQPITKLNQNELVRNLKKLILMSPDWEGSAQNWNEDPKEGLRLNIESILKYEDVESDAYFTIYNDYYTGTPVKFVKAMVKLGFDGYYVPKPHFDMEDVTHYIIYNPSIIKLIDINQIDEDEKYIKTLLRESLLKEYY